MEHIITRDFSISRDFRSVDWGATLWLNLLRAVGGGIVFAIVGLCIESMRKDMGVGFLLALPLTVPFAYLVAFLPIGLFCALLAKMFPYVGIVTFMLSLYVVLGDPLVWILSLFAPRAVPVAKPGFMNLALILWVLKPEDAVEVTITNTTASKVL